ncbi:hypothetical protein IFM89_035549 [Coptis chinensis]|uniref:U1-C C2H2-type zinc finger domain-containing protein n=1 Tax=Coptis chinensis TaxID=261450 RepID=A0A835HX93_9MAGN|nr:hypothetical protein IFM89_035549 [Coptis chinensis]
MILPSVRKQHNAGYKHKGNVRAYYQEFEQQQRQSLIDQQIKEHLGQAAVFRQVGAAYNQHLTFLPQRPNHLLPTPTTFKVSRPVVGFPGYGVAPSVPSMISPPGASTLSLQVNGMPRPPALSANSWDHNNPPLMVPNL